MNLLDPYEPPFKPKRLNLPRVPTTPEGIAEAENNIKLLEELHRNLVTEDRAEDLANKWDKEVEEARKGKSFTSGKEVIDDILE